MFDFTFVPKTDDELSALNGFSLLPEGVYPFYVKEVISRVSNALNPMLELKLCVADNDGNERVITDYLLTTEKMMFKLKHFCDAIGFQAEYERGSFDYRKCINRGGKLKLIIQKGNQKPDGSGSYPDKNAVKDYVPLIKIAEKSVDQAKEFNDDINF